MGALRKSDLNQSPRTAKPAAPVPPKPKSQASALLDSMRARTDYANDTGYGPLYFAAMAELPRISSGAVCTHFLMWVGLLSYGRPDKPKKGRHEWTLPITVENLAELCRCHVRDIQRQLRDLAKPSAKNPDGRGLVDVKCNRRGEYTISPLYRAWASLPDYVSGRPVAIDDPEPDADDSDPVVEASKGAVRLVRRPQRVRGGRACRSIPVNVGVKSFRLQHVGPDLVFDAFVEGGQMVIATRLFESEQKANVRDTGVANDSGRHPRASEIIGLFDPLLQKWGNRLLVGDAVALQRACDALDGIPFDFLSNWLNFVGDKPRASRSISGPKVVASIIAEAVRYWKAGAGKSRPSPAAGKAPAAAGKKTGFREGAKRVLMERLRRDGGI